MAEASKNLNKNSIPKPCSTASTNDNIAKDSEILIDHKDSQLISSTGLGTLPTSSLNSNSKPPCQAQQWENSHVIKYPKLCGSGAALVNILATFPINKFSFRQQVESTNIRTQIKIFNEKLKFESRNSGRQKFGRLAYLYRGVSIPMIQKVLSTSIMYDGYAKVRNSLNHSFPEKNGSNFESKFTASSHCFLAALAAGTFEAVLCSPLERCQAILQDRRFDNVFVKNSSSSSNSNLIMQVMRHLQDKNSLLNSIRNWYKGFVIIITRNSISSFIYFSLRDYYKTEFSQQEQDQNPSQNSSKNASENASKNDSTGSTLNHIFFGMLSGAIGCTTCFWLNTWRVKYQTDMSNKNMQNCLSETMSSNKNVYHKGLYYGWRVAVIRGSISWGIMNFMFEYMNGLTGRFLV